jgi:hypothetical protein
MEECLDIKFTELLEQVERMKKDGLNDPRACSILYTELEKAYAYYRVFVKK